VSGVRAVAVRAACAALAIGALAHAAAAAPVRLVDGFEDASLWKPVPADGVEMKLTNEPGVHGRALRVDFRFVKGGGYAVVHRDVALDLPENYAIRFRVRGACPNENLELKLVDSTGANVWWCNRRDFAFPAEWRTLSTRKRQITYAWGPLGGGTLRRAAAIEFAITAGDGGQGTVWLDDLGLVPLPAEGTPPPPIVARGSSAAPGAGAARAVDGHLATGWAPAAGDARPWLELDLGVAREFGGLELTWSPNLTPRDYAVDFANDDGGWRRARTVVGGARPRDVLQLPESETRRIRVAWTGSGRAPRLDEVTLLPVAFGDSPESLFTRLAHVAPRGRYPRPYVGEQRYWTVIGAPGDSSKLLFAEDGAIEIAPCGASLEPFLIEDGKLVTWADAERTVSSPEGVGSQVQQVEWRADSLRLVIHVQSRADSGRGVAFVQYGLSQMGSRARRVTLALAIRPFQVNPPAQFLNRPGGVARIHALSFDSDGAVVDGRRRVLALRRPGGGGAFTFDQGDVTTWLDRGHAPAASAVFDSSGLASGALLYDFTLAARSGAAVDVALPMTLAPRAGASPAELEDVEARVRRAAAQRDVSPERGDTLAHVSLPDREVQATLLAQRDWIEIERVGPSLRPGARAYARSWIRDGALMSAALLRMGDAGTVRAFIDWYAGATYANGKVPCCVGDHGSDPTPEHDSEGEFIYLVAEYVRATGDTALARRVWPQVLGAAQYLDTLRAERLGAEWRTPANAPYLGLLPPSISHEGYSAKPMHSYWDDLFALRGYRDAAELAGVVGDAPAAARLRRSRDAFAHDLAASIPAAMAAHHIDYMPGCADLGDFDATSTTIALDPVEAGDVVPRAALERTFERYWKFFRDRRDGREPWDAYTPYEMRAIGAFVRLGWRERADSLLTFFMDGRRPRGWRQWPEVVWKDERAPRFLGDLPHAWVGSDFVRSVLTMLAYEREADGALVLAAGVPERWAQSSSGVRVHGMLTRWGALRYDLTPTERGYEVKVGAIRTMPPGGIAVAVPGVTREWTARVNGSEAAIGAGGEVTLRALPATVELAPR
jgi:hypothetical protein